MPSTNAERQKKFRKRQQARAALSVLFENHVMDELNALAAEFDIGPGQALERLVRFANKGRDSRLIRDPTFTQRFGLLLDTSMANDPSKTGYRVENEDDEKY